MKHNGRTNDVPLCEATQKRKGWTILWSKTATATQRIYNFMTRKEKAKDGPVYEAKLENTG